MKEYKNDSSKNIVYKNFSNSSSNYGYVDDSSGRDNISKISKNAILVIKRIYPKLDIEKKSKSQK